MLKDTDPKLIRYVINKYIPFHRLAKIAGLYLPNTERSCFCIFHDNTETPAAKLFRDVEGDRLWCFAENRMYFPYDIFRLKMIQHNPETVFRKIWAQLSESKKELVLQESSATISFLPSNWEEIKKRIEPYKTGEMTLDEVLTELLKLERKPVV